jgi:hypothetical protein
MLVRGALVLVTVMLMAAAAHADGTVFRARGCGDYVFLSSPTGYSVLVSSDASGIKEGDEMRGDVDHIGHPVLFDATAARSVFAQVAERNLTRAEVTQRIAARCRSPSGGVVVNGYVSRATGCGSKIFVNTPMGYTVLEQLSGGLVANGDTLVGPIDHPGRAIVEDKQSGGRIVVFVDDLWLSKSAAATRIKESCRTR